MNNKCDLSTCRKRTTNTLSCISCEDQFCSEGCKLTHISISHRTTSTIKRKSLFKSPFLKLGEFRSEVQYDPLYDFSNFEVLKSGSANQVIGSGAFGDVLLARNRIDHKFYAVKQMSKQRIVENGLSLDIVKREIDIHIRLIHENIVMEYVSGGTLFHLIKRSKGLDERTAFKNFIQAVSAVNFLHENDLVHRDIKPENLLLDENGVVKLCDFGWCVQMEKGARSTFCGTYEYMAPEIINEDPYHKAIDCWSLGVLLYELLHGYSPFRAKDNKDDDDYMEVFKNIKKFNFTVEKQLSKQCGDLLKKLLSPDMNSRMKVKDIFFHPWVTSFEADFKKEKLSVYRINDKSKFGTNQIENKENLATENKNEIEPKNMNNFQNNAFVEDQKNNLFEKVMNKVKEKNKGKKKIKSQKPVEKEKDMNKTEILIVEEKSPIKKNKRKGNMTMLEELEQLENKIDDLETKIQEKSNLTLNNNQIKSLDLKDYSIEHLKKFENILDREENQPYSDREKSNVRSAGFNKLNKCSKEHTDEAGLNNSMRRISSEKEAQQIKMNNSLDITKSVEIQISEKLNRTARITPNTSNLFNNSKNEIEKDVLKENSKDKPSILTAIEILEKAQECEPQREIKQTEKKEKHFFSFLNVFRCGHNN